LPTGRPEERVRNEPRKHENTKKIPIVFASSWLRGFVVAFAAVVHKL
jgi:hypothetical protein